MILLRIFRLDLVSDVFVRKSSMISRGYASHGIPGSGSVLDSGICTANVPGLLLFGQLVFRGCSSVALIVLIVYGLLELRSTPNVTFFN